MIKVSRSIFELDSQDESEKNKAKAAAASAIIQNALIQHLEAGGTLDSVKIGLSLGEDKQINITIS